MRVKFYNWKSCISFNKNVIPRGGRMPELYRTFTFHVRHLLQARYRLTIEKAGFLLRSKITSALRIVTHRRGGFLSYDRSTANTQTARRICRAKKVPIRCEICQRYLHGGLSMWFENWDCAARDRRARNELKRLQTFPAALRSRATDRCRRIGARKKALVMDPALQHWS
jgi:hypothetical protein